MAHVTNLPDPTAHLNWSDFKGCIHDFLNAHAQRHPERPFVVETESDVSAERTFTYRQINEASNVLSHHLIQKGVERGEVVMIYAYRGVDLVVSIMGVLKAGATFSVIDPAYPPDRQCIYLDVARPTALIVIDKASMEEADVPKEVRTWIKENLQIKAEVPELELLDNGTLLGGRLIRDGADIFTDQQSLKSTHPDVVVGPDSTPTLSFTSGSEGRPKGVKGRHYSLTYYTPWMAERFNLSEKDRFTMLSGIAHDPIQRDIFTPIILGATLLVPAREDIEHQRLAEWMRRYGATVTHLTPAMGQILVGGAVAEFPSLHHAFFVGDVLIKRDCRLLQALAPNVRIVNMFGTTETQRAVSYYELPSRSEDPAFLENMGDTIPAGQGMKDVQLLVVDRTSLEKGTPRLCRVREVGEIYCRAGGLAEGYLGSDELNKEKFIRNFFLPDPEVWMRAERDDFDACGHKEPWRDFWRGPRDRLYKSGDLGFYREDGNVECTGRADGQVKIRGFRIELGEIDTHLSHHPLVQENVTMVRRNENEEPTLYSWIVPDMQKWSAWLQERGLSDNAGDDVSMVGMLRRFRLLRKDAQALLRKKLPSYAVPSVIIPLRKFPLTPNFKVDRRALPYPDANELGAFGAFVKVVQPSTATEKAVAEIWASRIRGISADTIDIDDRFVELGGHSMKGQEILFDVRKWKGISLSMSTLFRNPTLKEFAAAVDAASALEIGAKADSAPPEADYARDGELLKEKLLPTSFPTGPIEVRTVFITGVTGFLGASILSNLFSRNLGIRVIALVRAKSGSEALDRVVETCTAYATWSDSWKSQIKCIPGDLSQENFGISPDVWYMLENTIDVIIHMVPVHWIHTYATLKPANTLSTLAALTLCSRGRPKTFTFISSTSVLDTPYYKTLTTPLLESSILPHSRTGLSTGYGQTKYVSEYLIHEAGLRGLRASIVRAGYITGNPDNGVGPTDDFLLRMLKGSIQLSCHPDMGPNTINLVPVTYAANLVLATSLHPPPPPPHNLRVLHTTPHPPLPFHTFLSTLSTHGYLVPQVPYPAWRQKLETYVSAPPPEDQPQQQQHQHQQQDPHALLPLFDWVTDDLPANTNSVPLDDSTARAVLALDNGGVATELPTVTQEVVATYLAFMVDVGFIPAPPGGGTSCQGLGWRRRGERRWGGLGGGESRVDGIV